MSIKNYILLISILIMSCNKKEIEKCDSSQSLYSLADFPIGVAVNPGQLSRSDYHDIVINQFNNITAENIFKPEYLHPSENYFHWTEADNLVAFCKANNKNIHGHTLIWHHQIPFWMSHFKGNKAQWEALFKEHIQTICKHFKGKVKSWDVVNEAFNDNGTLRNSIWKEKIGNAYIEKAFRYAHEADPNALLFYNDYNIALNKTKRDAIIKLCKNLKLRGVPIHGIGMQMHISISYPENEQIADAIKEISDASFKVHLSEVDISINPFNENIEPTKELLNQQAQKMASVIYSYNSIPKQHKFGITFWGVGDRDSWLQKNTHPLLFDDNYEPKPIYCKLKNAL